MKKLKISRIVTPILGMIFAGGLFFFDPIYNFEKHTLVPSPKQIKLEELIKNPEKYEEKEIITEGFPQYRYRFIYNTDNWGLLNSKTGERSNSFYTEAKIMEKMYISDSTRDLFIQVSEYKNNTCLSPVHSNTGEISFRSNPLKLKGKLKKYNDGFKLEIPTDEYIGIVN